MKNIKALRSAVRNKNKPEVALLLGNIVDINIQDGNGNTPLHLAVQVLVKDILGKEKYYTNPDDVLNACRDSIDIVLQLATQADVSIQNKYGQCPMHKALGELTCYFTHDPMEEILDKLLTKEALESTKTSKTYTMHGLNFLHVAMIKGRFKNARLAISKGIDVTLKANKNESALAFLCMHHDAPRDLIQQLAHPDNINAVDYNGFAPLHIAAQNGKSDIIADLIKYGADVDLSDSQCFPLNQYQKYCAASLQPEVYAQLLPMDPSHLPMIVIDFVQTFFSTMPQNYDNVATILEMILLNLTKMKFKRVAFREYKPNKIDVCYQGGKGLLHTVQTLLSLRELGILSILLTQNGVDIETIQIQLQRSPEAVLDDYDNQQSDEINSLWEQYRENQQNGLSLFDICCQRIKRLVYPVTKSKMTQLGLPSAVIDEMSKVKISRQIISALQKMHDSEEFKNSDYRYTYQNRYENI